MGTKFALVSRAFDLLDEVSCPRVARIEELSLTPDADVTHGHQR